MKIMIPSEKAKILDNNIEFDASKNSLVIGNNLEVDGVLKVSGGEEVITSARAVIDEGNPQLNLKQGNNIVDITDLRPVLFVPNWKIEEENFKTSFPAGIQVTKRFCAVSKYNSILFVVANIFVENTSGAEVTLGNNCIMSINDIPDEISSKIYAYDGTPLNVNSSSIKPITAVRVGSDAGNPLAGFYTQHNASINKATAPNKIDINFRDLGIIPSTGTRNYTLRFWLLV